MLVTVCVRVCLLFRFDGLKLCLCGFKCSVVGLTNEKEDPIHSHSYLSGFWLVHHKSHIHCLGIKRRASWLPEGRQPSEDACDSNVAFIVRGICRLDTYQHKTGNG